MKLKVEDLHITIPHLKPVETDEGYRFELVNDITLTARVDDQDYTYTVPKGYVTDGASIPRAIWSIIGSPYQPQFIRAAIIHDLMCNQYDALPKKSKIHLITMSELFYHILRHNGVSRLKAKLMYNAVFAYKQFF